MNTNTQALAGHHAVVTGGGSGIGAVTAEALLRNGARVTLMGRDAARLDAQRAILSKLGEVSYLSVDVGNEAAVAAAFEQAGAVDLLINNAGQAQAAPFAHTDMALWQRMLDVNLTGVFLCTRAVLPGMLERGAGRIVNIASTAGQIGYAYVAAYCAAKHGVIGLTRALALEVATKGITVNAVCPGYTETELLRASLDQITSKTSRSEQEARSILLRHNPQNRFVAPDEVANAVLWLCMPGSAAITGQSISVSGGEVT
ncbi:MAG: SDR family NAD(P)-dependent oxidoreductase [Paraburkholderia sp.]|uniref:SDR family NAD(P)-dependent oxidoreductase n=1 Tax=Paraburkholderia sp. TaxID=1926495 RepID=UPI003C43C19C